MFGTPIESIQQAKEYFRSMGCSHFHMACEYPQKYEEYKRLNISKQEETKWTIERLSEYYNDIMEDKNDTILWVVHSSMYDLVEILKSDQSLKIMLEATQFIRDKVSPNKRIIVAETINGRRCRKFRSGLIYLSYDLNNIPMAKTFVELSLHFSSNKDRALFGNIRRYESAIKLCNDIRLELGL